MCDIIGKEILFSTHSTQWCNALIHTYFCLVIWPMVKDTGIRISVTFFIVVQNSQILEIIHFDLYYILFNV